MNKPNLLSALSLAVLLAATGVGDAAAQSTPKIDRAGAERIALGKVPGGKIKSAELEQEKGVQVWSFDIAKPGERDITEVLVNAANGEIVEISTETPASEAKEAEDEGRDRHAKR